LPRAGLVYEPTFAEGLAFTVDYFDVRIDNSIQAAGGRQHHSSNCYASEQRTDCDKITRGPSNSHRAHRRPHGPTSGRAETNGFDVQIQYTYDVKGAGRFRHNLEGTRLLKYTEFFPDGMGGEIEWKGLGVYGPRRSIRSTGPTSRRFGNLGPVGAGFNVRYVHSFKECRNADDSVRDDCRVADVVSRKVDPNVTADVLANYTIRVPGRQDHDQRGCEQRARPRIRRTSTNGFLATSDYATYDYLGRFFYLRVAQLF